MATYPIERQWVDGDRRLAALLRDVVAEQQVEAVLAKVATTLYELIPCQGVAIWEASDEGELTVAIADGDDAEEMRGLRIRLGEGLTGTAALERRPLVCNKAHLDPRASLVPGTKRVPESVACMPLIANGKLLGVLGLYRRSPRRYFDAGEIELVADFAAVAAIALGNAKARAELELLAITDDLTGLANRRHFRAELERAIAVARRYDSPLSLILLDLDNFKSINDRYGHIRGDDALKVVADSIRRRLRAADLAARIGGDEFAVLLPETGRRQADALASTLAESIRTALPAPLTTTASIGVSTFDRLGEADLLEEADGFLYKAKNNHPTPSAIRFTTRRGSR
jgi:diguanylate cyclase (GGDEF)-like protein